MDEKLKIQISAVLCTHNRASYLRQALESLNRQSLSQDEFEVIVVDNRCSDSTRAIANEFSGKFKNFQYFYEPVLGHSRSRNRAWSNALGKWVAYLDDDAVASRTWLENIKRVFESVSPMPGCAGGQINLIWEAAKPQWLDQNLFGLLTYLKHAPQPLPLPFGKWLYGANIAFPKSVLELIGGFDESLGRRGKNLMSNDETQAEYKILKKGYTLYYDPSILVWHHAPKARLQQKWFLRRHYWEGRSRVVWEHLEKSPSAARGLKYAQFEWKEFWTELRSFPRALFPTSHPAIFQRQCALCLRWGRGVGFLMYVGERIYKKFSLSGNPFFGRPSLNGIQKNG